MKIFIHHIYELKKGLRRLVLHTCSREEIESVSQKLNSESIPFLIHQISDKRANVFFGDEYCINMVKEFSTLELNKLSDQEDFILGTLLGYDLRIQCERFLKRVRCDGMKLINAEPA